MVLRRVAELIRPLCTHARILQLDPNLLRAKKLVSSGIDTIQLLVVRRNTVGPDAHGRFASADSAE